MRPVRYSAPGKLFLLGEYAVLEGAPALVTAVDRRVVVMATIGCDAPGSECSFAAAHLAGAASSPTGWRLSAPALGIDDLVIGPHGILREPVDPGLRAKLAVVEGVRSTLEAAGAHLPETVNLAIDSAAFAQDGHKLGLGSSAAVAAALTAALCEASGLSLNRDDTFGLALAAHRSAQGGAGSGADVAASVYGGLISYTDGAVPRPLHRPDGLALSVVVTGTGSSTTDLVGLVAGYAGRDPAGYRSDLARLAALAADAADALADPDRFLQLAESYFDALAVLDDHAGAGIITEQHRQLREIVARAGGVFKSTGAGGGDVGLVFSRTGASEDKIADALTAAGVRLVPLDFGAPGVHAGSGLQ